MSAMLGHAGGFLLLLLLPSSIRRPFLRREHLLISSRRPQSSAHRRLMSASATTSLESSIPDKSRKEASCTSLGRLACPICYYQLRRKDGSLSSENMSSLECNTCKKSYHYGGDETYIDMTIASGSEDYSEAVPPSTELFRSPLVSFLYERGWRQNFVVGGFPGPEKEFEMAKNFFKPTFSGTIIDASCGSGLFSRLFYRSGLYKDVIALDFSENMLRQCSNYMKEEGISKENLLLVRADISRLPFVSSSIDAVHAGAALHCWPSPSVAVAEISRILRPNGVFVATTFIADGLYASLPFMSLARQVFGRFTGQRLYLSQEELEDLFRACGFVNVSCKRNGPFVMISASKPS